MNLKLPIDEGENYKSSSQKIRVITESWATRHLYCPNCGCTLEDFEKNRPVADLYCPCCSEEYELKSTGKAFGSKVVDGAYKTMIQRIKSHRRPNLVLLSYNPENYKVTNITAIPKQFFATSVIEARKPLPSSARRAGWQGCNILLKGFPPSGKITLVQEASEIRKENVLSNWRRVKFLEQVEDDSLKGWILDVMKCIEGLDKKEFTLKEVYQCEENLQRKHPKNKHVKDKIRQQLQLLRDKGYIQFAERGTYRLK